ncbi:MAG: alpha/beta hydrolase [Oceanospirillaceae bacterium]|nr:alpha/beta hydrolase [Oceanospirillaceae bacterium]
MYWMIGLLSALGVLALFSQQIASRTEQQFAPTGAFVEVDGLRMHYREAGTGQVVVLIHGASTSLLDFSASIFTPLSRNHRVIAIDRPGHGYSDRPAGPWPDPARQAELIRRVLEKLDAKDPILVGHSWSGSVVLAYLLVYPGEAPAGVLLAGATHPWTGGVAWYNALAGIPVLGELFAHTLVYPAGMLALNRAVAEVFAPNRVPDDYTAATAVRLSLRPNSFRANAEDIRGLSDFLALQSQRYGEIEQPLLLLTGSEDTIVPAWNHSDRLFAQAPNAERLELEGTGHALHHTHPDRVVALIEAFAARAQNGNRPVDTSADVSNVN